MKMDTEIWKTIPILGAEKYLVSNYGNVMSFKNSEPKLLKPQNNKKYFHVGLVLNGKTKSCLIHHLVLLSFVGPKPIGLVRCHNDGNSYNNRLENLRYDTHANNMKDMILHGTVSHPNGSKNGMSKLKESDIMNIRQCKMSKREIIKTYHLSRRQAEDILNNKAWRHVTV